MSIFLQDYSKNNGFKRCKRVLLNLNTYDVPLINSNYARNML